MLTSSKAKLKRPLKKRQRPFNPLLRTKSNKKQQTPDQKKKKKSS